MYKLSNKKTFNGFTLVELIIVITILGILSTIAYISFQGYTKDARDGIRMSDIKQIYNGLSIYKTQTEKTLLPDNYINIQSGTTTISYQGYAGAGVLRNLKISGGKDPGTKDYYIYTTDVNTKKAQLMTYMETSDKDVQLLSQLKDIRLINQANAITNTGYYQDKKIYVYGDKIGILTNNKVPLQETTTNTGIDITTLTGNITTYFGGNTYSGGVSTSTGLTLVNQINSQITNSTICNPGYSLIGGVCILNSLSNLNLVHTSNNKEFFISFSGGVNLGLCKLQFESSGVWIDILSANNINCDLNLSSIKYILNGDGWKNSWNNTEIRILKLSNNTVLGTFSQKLSCNTIVGSGTSTLLIDEDCDGNWDNLNNSTYVYNYPMASGYYIWDDGNACKNWCYMHGYDNICNNLTKATYGSCTKCATIDSSFSCTSTVGTCYTATSISCSKNLYY